MKRFFGLSDKIRRDADLFFADLTGEPLLPRRGSRRTIPIASPPPSAPNDSLLEQDYALPPSSPTSEALPVTDEDTSERAEIILLSKDGEDEGEQSPLIPTNDESEYQEEDQRPPIEGIPMLGRILWP